VCSLCVTGCTPSRHIPYTLIYTHKHQPLTLILTLLFLYPHLHVVYCIYILKVFRLFILLPNAGAAVTTALPTTAPTRPMEGGKTAGKSRQFVQWRDVLTHSAAVGPVVWRQGLQGVSAAPGSLTKKWYARYSQGWNSGLDLEPSTGISQSRITTGSVTPICRNTCATWGQRTTKVGAGGDCDDSGPTATSAVCQLGTDCDDCGPREVPGTTKECGMSVV
jgi:hypothetical protein